MTGRQRSKLAMFLAVDSLCSQYRHLWRQLPALRDAFERFQTALTTLAKFAKTQRRHTGGAAQEKVRIRLELCTLTFEVASAMRAKALITGDPKSATKLAFSLTQLRVGKDALCLERCRQILATAQNKVTELEPFGVTEQKLSTLAAALDKFSMKTVETRSIRTANKDITTQLPPLFKAVEDVLYNQLDNLIPQFRTAAPRFFTQYQEARVMRQTVELAQVVAESEPEEPPLLD